MALTLRSSYHVGRFLVRRTSALGPFCDTCSFQFNRFHTSGGLPTVTMPIIMDAQEGRVDKWHKKVGNELKVGDRLCEVSLDELIIGIDAQYDGYLAQILVPEGESVKVGENIASYALNKSDYLTFLAALQSNLSDAAKLNEAMVEVETQDVLENTPVRADAAVLMRAIKALTDAGHFDNANDGQGHAKKLLSLARKGNKELLAVFEASFDAQSLVKATIPSVAFDVNSDSFDTQFFISNAREISNEVIE